MLITVIDDEVLALKATVNAVKEALPEAEVRQFTKCSELLSFAAENRIDVAFLDINMRGYTGIEVAGKLEEINPEINIIFVTGYSEHKSEAMDMHVFVSEAVRRAYPFELRAGQRGMVCYNGIAPEFRPLPEVRARREPEVFTVGCVANFDPLKDQMTLLKAMEKLEAEGGRWKTVFVGSGPELARCRRYAEQRGINAEFRKEMPHAEMPQLYNEIELMALPSLSEGFCCAYVEAWACGTPVVG